MSRGRILSMLLAVCVVLTLAVLSRTLAADEGIKPAYQYVGLDRTLARVDVNTGRVWILGHPEVSPSVSILSLLDKPGLRWREIQLERERPPTGASSR